MQHNDTLWGLRHFCKLIIFIFGILQLLTIAIVCTTKRIQLKGLSPNKNVPSKKVQGERGGTFCIEARLTVQYNF